jgi:hypothetical protein
MWDDGVEGGVYVSWEKRRFGGLATVLVLVRSGVGAWSVSESVLT